MKKLVLTMTVAAFTLGAFAGENCCDKAKATADKAKTACAEKSVAACPANKEAAKCPATGATAKKESSPKPADKPKGQANKS